MKKKISKRRKKYSLGTGKTGVVRHYIQDPSEALVENEIMLAKAKQKAMDNGWAKGLDIFGNMAVQYGSNMMSSGGGGAGAAIPAGGKASGGGVVAGGGNGGAFGQGFGDWMGNNSGAMNSIVSMLPMLAQMAGPGFAMGGVVPGVPVEVEGDEVGETPQGELLEFKGASHEEGGMDLQLPEGTEIFSKRIKIEGKTMAERKKARQNKMLKLEKLLEKSGSDKVLKDTLKKTAKNNELEEQKDMKIQETISNMKKMLAYGTGAKGVQKYADGTGPGGINHGDPDPNNPENPYWYMTDEEFVAKSQVFQDLSNAEANRPGDEKTASTQPGFQFPTIGAGDATTLAGTMYSAFAPMKNTIANRAGDTPNINAYKDFGNDALDAVEKSKAYVAGQRDSALTKMDDNRKNIMSSNRKTSRSVNTNRALDLAAFSATNKADADIYDNFAKQMMGLLSQQAGFENEQDRVVMGGEQNRDLADRQSRDNYFSQMAEDIATKGQGIQQIGKNLNDNKANTMAEKAVNDTSVNFKYTNGTLTDKAGNVVLSQAQIGALAKKNNKTVDEFVKMYLNNA